MTCPHCKGKARLEPRMENMTTEFRGESFVIQTRTAVCPSCSYRTVSGQDMPEFMRLTADAYRKRHGLLTSQEIKTRREAMNMNQELFAAHIGVGSASIKRWELGHVQDRAMDRLLKLTTDVKEAESNLKLVRTLTSSGVTGVYEEVPQRSRIPERPFWKRDTEEPGFVDIENDEFPN